MVSTTSLMAEAGTCVMGTQATVGVMPLGLAKVVAESLRRGGGQAWEVM